MQKDQANTVNQGEFSRHQSLHEAFFARVARDPSAVVYEQAVELPGTQSAGKGLAPVWEKGIAAEVMERVKTIADYLNVIGVKKGDRVAILANSHSQWSEAEFGIYAAEGIMVTLYTSDLAAQNGFVLWDSRPDVIFVENREQLAKIQEVMSTPFIVPASEKGPEHETTINLKKIICFEDKGVEIGGKVESLNRILNGEALKALGDAKQPVIREGVTKDDLASIIYSSGTTGAAKGVVATHGQHLANMDQIANAGLFDGKGSGLYRMLREVGFVQPLEGLADKFHIGAFRPFEALVDRIGTPDTIMVCVPQAHALGQRMGHMGFLMDGSAKFVARADLESSALTAKTGKAMARDLREADASFYPMVPKMLVRFQSEIEKSLAEKGAPNGNFADYVSNLEKKIAEMSAAGKSPDFLTRAQQKIAEATGLGQIVKQGLPQFVMSVYRQVAENKFSAAPLSEETKHYHNILRLTGLGPMVHKAIQKRVFGEELEGIISGAAKLDVQTFMFFQSIGVNVYEGYGSSEGNTPLMLNVKGKMKPGTVGVPLDSSLEFKQLESGELIVRGPNISAGYWERPKQTAETFDAEGFYHTGDIFSRDEQGFWKITGRDKDGVKLSSGVFVQVNVLEEKLQSIPGVADAIVACQDRPHPVALITVDIEGLKRARPEFLNAPLPLLGNSNLRRAVVDSMDGPSRTNEASIRDYIMQQIEASVNPELIATERIRNIEIIPALTIGDGLTPSFKVQRSKVLAKYSALVDRLYS